MHDAPSPGNVRGHRQVARRAVGHAASLVRVCVLETKLGCELAALAVQRMCWIRLMLEPALAVTVEVARIQGPAIWPRVAEDPAVAWLLAMSGVASMRGARLAALSCRLFYMRGSPCDRMAAGITVRFFTTLCWRRHPRAVGHASIHCFWRCEIVVVAAPVAAYWQSLRRPCIIWICWRLLRHTTLSSIEGGNGDDGSQRQ